MLILFASTLFLSASLLFLVQPMFAKMVLPLFGGTTAVWNTSMVFFQANLLAGYAYAHATARWLGVRRQALLHLALLLVALLVLPVGIARVWTPTGSANPVPSLLMMLLVSVGLPSFVISSTAPMLQKWFTHTGHPAAADPYFLYGASNLGSMVALLGYPTLVEPFLRLSEQTRAWTAAYVLLAALMIFCAAVLWRSRGEGKDVLHSPGAGDREAGATGADPPEPVTGKRRMMWLLWSFAPSSLLLGVTSHIGTDIAAVPLLWVLPLAVYLLTFILVFARRPPLSRSLAIRLQPFLIVPLALFFAWQVDRHWLTFPFHILAFFVTAMVCHGALADSRPPAAHLTEFYLWLSIGGVLGGLFNALVAPAVFDTVAEYPAAIALASLLRPRRNPENAGPRDRLLDFILPLALAAILVAIVRVARIETLTLLWRTPVKFLVFGLAGALLFTFRDRPARFGLGVGALLLTGYLGADAEHSILYRNRNFYGVKKVVRLGDGSCNVLYHGRVVHGAQLTDPFQRFAPLAYYHPTGPLGDLFLAHAGRLPNTRVGVIGLGVGSVASYGEPGQKWTFFEIDPAVERIARDARNFTFLRDTRAEVRVILGDARLSLAQVPNRHFGVLIVDAFSSDAIPVHLITREALRLYLSKLSENGILVFNITNAYLDLEPVLGNLARDAGLIGILRKEGDDTSAYKMKYGSAWALMARRPEDLVLLARDPRWGLLPVDPEMRVWTDDFSNILSVFKYEVL